jgi:hypothetical protein
MGYLRETPITVLTKEHGVSHDTAPYFMERFRDAYTNRLQDFARNVLREKAPPITIDDGMEALCAPASRPLTRVRAEQR